MDDRLLTLVFFVVVVTYSKIYMKLIAWNNFQEVNNLYPFLFIRVSKIKLYSTQLPLFAFKNILYLGYIFRSIGIKHVAVVYTTCMVWI